MKTEYNDLERLLRDAMTTEATSNPVDTSAARDRLQNRLAGSSWVHRRRAAIIPAVVLATTAVIVAALMLFGTSNVQTNGSAPVVHQPTPTATKNSQPSPTPTQHSQPSPSATHNPKVDTNPHPLTLVNLQGNILSPMYGLPSQTSVTGFSLNRSTASLSTRLNDGTTTVWTAKVNGSTFTPTSTQVSGDSPAISPNGEQVAFTRAVGPKSSHTLPRRTEVFTMNADGSNVRQMTFKHVPDYGLTALTPSWTPDGVDIVYSEFAPPVPHASGNVWMVASNGESAQQKLFSCWCFDLAYSPQGGTMSYVKNSVSPRIWLSGQDGYAQNVGVGSDPQWSPDGSMIAYIHRSQGGFLVRVLQVSSGQSRTIATTSRAQPPVWWSNDKLLVGATQ
jgi:hypothetical protein